MQKDTAQEIVGKMVNLIAKLQRPDAAECQYVDESKRQYAHGYFHGYVDAVRGLAAVLRLHKYLNRALDKGCVRDTIQGIIKNRSSQDGDVTP